MAQRQSVRISGIDHARAYRRNHARRLNTLGRGFLTWPSNGTNPPSVDRSGTAACRIHGTAHDICVREVHSRIRRFAIRANACASRRRTSAPSRASTSTWRAAGLLRRQHCGQVRVAIAPTTTQPLSAAARRAPGLCLGLARGIRCIATSHRETPWTAVPKDRGRHAGERRFRRCIAHTEPCPQQPSSPVLSARVESARRTCWTTSATSPNIDCVHELGEHP